MQAIIIVSALVVVASASPALLASPVYTAQSPIRSQYHSQDGHGQYSYGYNGDLSAKVESRSLDGVTRGSYSYVDAQGLLQTVQYTADSVNGFQAAATNLPTAPIDNGLAPAPVQDTPEVQAAKIEHARAYNEAAYRAAASPDPENPIQVAAYAPAPAPAFAFRAIPAPAPVFANAAGTSFSYSHSINGDAIIAPALPRAAYFASPYAQAPIAHGGAVVPQDEPEVAAAKAAHLQAVEEQKARIAAASY